MVDRRGNGHQNCLEPAWGKGLRTSCSLRPSELRPPAKLPGLTVLCPVPGERQRAFVVRTPSSPWLLVQVPRPAPRGPGSRRPGCPGGRRGADRRRLCWPGESRRTLPRAGGAGAGAARELRTVRIGKAEDRAEAEARRPERGGRRQTSPRGTPAASRQVEWTSELAGSGPSFDPRESGWGPSIRSKGSRPGNRFARGKGGEAVQRGPAREPAECSRRARRVPAFSRGALGVSRAGPLSPDTSGDPQTFPNRGDAVLSLPEGSVTVALSRAMKGRAHDFWWGEGPVKNPSLLGLLDFPAHLAVFFFTSPLHTEGI